MDEQEQGGQRRRRRSRAEAAQLAAEFAASGLCREEFCRSRGLSVVTLERYRKRQREAAGESLPAQRWVAVEVAGAGYGSADGAGSGLAITLAAGRRIEVGRGFDAQTLVDLLGVLERS